MLEYRRALTLHFEAPYYEGSATPIVVELADPAAVRGVGVRLQRDKESWHIYVSKDSDVPFLRLSLRAECPDFRLVTPDLQHGGALLLDAPLGIDTVHAGSGKIAAPEPGAEHFATLTCTLDPEPRHVTVQFSALHVHWIYTLAGVGGSEASIVDRSGDVAFAPLETQKHPHGEQVFQQISHAELPVCLRPKERFALKKGDQTLIQALPAACAQSIALRAVNPGTDPMLCCEIYVYLT